MFSKLVNVFKFVVQIFGISECMVLCECVWCNIEDGVIIDSYSVDCKVVIKLFNDVLVIEYVCVLCYYWYYFMVKGMLVDVVKVEFFEYVQQEQVYVGKLVECIVQFGGEFDFNLDMLIVCLYVEYKEGSDLCDMVCENLVVECIVIDSYCEMINFIGDCDIIIKCIFEEILVQEEEYVDEFVDLLDGWIGEQWFCISFGRCLFWWVYLLCIN